MPNDLTRRLLRLPRHQKKALVLTADGLICAWSAWASIYLRIGEWQWLQGNQWMPIAVAVLLGLPVFERFGLYKSILRHTGWPAMLGIVRACLVFGFLYSLIFTFVGVPDVPRTVGLIQPVLMFVSLVAFRAIAHHVLGGGLRRERAGEDRPRALIYGAGEAGRQLATAMRRSREMELVGFVDDDPSLHTGLLEGVQIHAPSEVAHLVQELDVTDVLLAVPSANRRRRRQIVDILRTTGVSIRTLPGLLDIARGRIHFSDIRPLQIEDLLGREAVLPDPALLEKNVTGKVVMVTGGGGSIGSELCRHILGLKPARLVIAEASEYALYAVHRDLLRRQSQGDGAGVEIVPLLASVQDEDRLRAIFERLSPETIYHAAAYKHVPLVEHNCLEGLKNNVFSTATTARLALDHGVADFVLISTDKAVRPTNVMGATKRLSEMVVQALADRGGATRYSIVRFGNVLGSSGSVVPLFREQIAAGGPVTLTHPDVTRYFMTIPEATQLVLQAGAMATGGDVFVLDMGEPVLVRDLAVNMIQLSGLTVRNEDRPDGDIEIEIVGLRPGEKLHEELLIGENPLPTMHSRIMRAQEQFLPLAELEPSLAKLRETILGNDVAGALLLLRALVPEYRSEQSLVDLLSDAGAGAEAQSAPAIAMAAKPRGEVAPSLAAKAYSS